MQSWNEVLARQERHEDALREAEKDRLVLHELALHKRRERFHCRVMAWLGRCLVAWGCCLQERYSGTLEPSAAR